MDKVICQSLVNTRTHGVAKYNAIRKPYNCLRIRGYDLEQFFPKMVFLLKNLFIKVVFIFKVIIGVIISRNFNQVMLFHSINS